jgi:RNase H-fold protein (predicted Holliday junction resolvase)
MEDIILGLSVNARMLGLAIILGNQLVDYHIQMRRESWTSQKKELILASLQTWCERYTIKNIALSVPYETQLSSETKELMESLKEHFSQNHISLFVYTPKTLHAFYKEPKTKKEIMRELVEQYPELTYCYKKEMRNKHKYYIKLFDAVEVGTIHSQRVIKKRIQE